MAVGCGFNALDASCQEEWSRQRSRSGSTLSPPGICHCTCGRNVRWGIGLCNYTIAGRLAFWSRLGRSIKLRWLGCNSNGSNAARVLLANAAGDATFKKAKRRRKIVTSPYPRFGASLFLRLTWDSTDLDRNKFMRQRSNALSGIVPRWPNTPCRGLIRSAILPQPAPLRSETSRMRVPGDGC